jgi:hypothetical protein
MAMKKNHILRKSIIPVVLMVCLLTTSVPTIAQNPGDENLTLSYTFPRPVVATEQLGEHYVDTVRIEGLPSIGQYGEPLLPVRPLRILLPYHSTVHTIDVTTDDPILLGSGYLLKPASKDVPLGIGQDPLFPTYSEELYTVTGVFPDRLCDTIGTYGFRGYQILYLTLYPVQYDTGNGELFYYPEMTITIQTEQDSTNAINKLYRDSEIDRNQLRDDLENDEFLRTYPSVGGQTREDYDLLIITTDELQPCFEPLAEFHTSQGLPTEIATLSDIGSTDPEAIRQYIRTEYLTHNIGYVLLGGDADVVPARMLWVSSGYGDITELPADLYYGCLDGTYNYDDDDNWGEPHDGENGGDVDLIAEVYVGRACVENSTEVDNFIQKTVSYVYTDDPYLNKALMVGEFLWDNPDTWGGDYMDELIDGSSAHGYNTTGVPSDEYTIDTLYDRDWPGNDWPKEEIIARINQNVHIINHLGHSWYDYNMKMDNDDADALTNTRYFFAYSQGCDNGGFDDPYGYDCIAEHFTVKTDHGAFAVVANARYGFGASGSTDGANQRYHREFIDAIFGEGKIQLGRANQDSKEDNLYRINQKVMRWCYYEINLFGDPTIDFFTHYPNNQPSTPETPSGSTSGEVGVQYTYTITANSDPDGDGTYYKFYWGDGQSSLWLGPYNPSETVSASHVWNRSGIYDVVVKCRDGYWAMSDISSSLPVNITGPFFEIGTIKGGFLTVSAEITNSGEGIATQVKRSITIERVRNNKIIVVTNTTIDQLEPGQSTMAQTDKPILGLGKIRITAAACAPNGQVFSKTVDAYVLLCFVLVIP